MSYILEFVGAVAAGTTIFVFVRGFVSRRAIDQLQDRPQQVLSRLEIDRLRDIFSGDSATRTTAADIDEMFIWVEDVEKRAKMTLDLLAAEGRNRIRYIGTTDSKSTSALAELEDLREKYKEVSYRIKSHMTEIQRPNTFSYLQKFLPEELEQHKEEIQEFLEDGMVDRLKDRKSAKLFAFKETLHLAIFIGKAPVFKLSKIRRRTIK